MGQLRAADLRDLRLAGRPACGGGKGGSHSSGDHGGAGARHAHRGFAAQGRPGADRRSHRDVRAARQGDRRRVRPLGSQPPARVHLGRRNRDHPVRWWDGEEPEGSLDGAKARLARPRPGEQFAYTLDLGDNCRARAGATSPTSTAAAGTAKTAAARAQGPNGLADLPPILPGWGPRQARPAASPADGSATRYRDLII